MRPSGSAIELLRHFGLRLRLLEFSKCPIQSAAVDWVTHDSVVVKATTPGMVERISAVAASSTSGAGGAALGAGDCGMGGGSAAS